MISKSGIKNNPRCFNTKFSQRTVVVVVATIRLCPDFQGAIYLLYQ